MALKLNIDLNFKDVNLGKLTQDASKVASTNFANSSDTTTEYATDKPNAYGGTSSSKLETVDFNNEMNEYKKTDSFFDKKNEPLSFYNDSDPEVSSSPLTFDSKSDVSKEQATNNFFDTTTKTSSKEILNKPSSIENQNIDNISKQASETGNTKNLFSSNINQNTESKTNFSSAGADKMTRSANIGGSNFSANKMSNASSIDGSGSMMMNNNFGGNTSQNDLNQNKRGINFSSNGSKIDFGTQNLADNFKVYTTASELFRKSSSYMTENLRAIQITNSLENYGIRKEDIKRIIDGKISIEDLFSEIQNDQSDNTRRRDMMYAAYLRAYEIDYIDMSSYKYGIEDTKRKLAELRSSKTKLGGREVLILFDMINNLKNGYDLDSLLNRPVAWEYYDERGIKHYKYDSSYMEYSNVESIEYRPVTYEELFGRERLDELVDLLTKESKQYIWTDTPEQRAYFQNLLEEYDTVCNDVYDSDQKIDEELENLENKLTTDEYIYSLIEDKVSYYMNFIDPYTIKEDFEENNRFDQTACAIVDRIKKDVDASTSVSTYSEARGLKGYHVSIDSKGDLVDVIACLINGESTSYLSGDFIDSKDSLLINYKRWYGLVDDTEKDIFNYIYNKESKEAAYRYLEDISSELDLRWLAKRTQEDQEFASAHPILSSAASIVVTPIEGISAAAASLNALINSEKIYRTNVYSAGDVWRAQVASDIAMNHGEGWSFIYSTGMSMADSVSLIALSAMTGGTATPALSATLMGSRAYVSTLNDALDRGLRDSDAVLLAAVSGIVETAMENYSVGHLLNLEEKLGKNTLQLVNKISGSIKNPVISNLATKSFYIGASALSQGLAEGEEEFATEILNYVSDIFIAKDLSNYSSSLEHYLSLGYTEEEALQNTMRDFRGQASQAFLGGFVSGICFGSFGGVSSTIKTSNAIAQNMYAELEGTKPVSNFAEALNINRQQLEQLGEIAEKMKKGQELTQPELDLFINGTIEMRSARQLKEKIFTSISNTLSSEKNKKNTIFSQSESKIQNGVYTLAGRNYESTYGKEYAQSLDEQISIPREVGKQLEQIFENDDYILGIHLSGSKMGEKINSEGLFLTGHSTSGAATKGIDQLQLNINFYNNTSEVSYLNFIRGIAAAQGYKTIDGIGDAVIIAIPKSDITITSKTGQGFAFNEGTNPTIQNNSQNALNPKYILGYVRNDNGSLGNINFNNRFINQEFLNNLKELSPSIVNGTILNTSSLELSDEEIQAKMDEYNALLESNIDLKQIIINEQKGYAVQIFEDVYEDYMRLKTLQTEIETGKRISGDFHDQISITAENRINDNEQIFDAITMPLSTDEILRKAQEKVLAGTPIEELSMAEKMKLGRDDVVREIDGYKLKSDCVYRVITKELYDLYVEQGFITGLDESDEYDPTGGNGGVDWYLGGACLKYGKGSKVGKVIIECPAVARYFITTHDNGCGMAKDPLVRHMKSSGYANPVPISMGKVVMHPDSSMIDPNIRNIQTNALFDNQVIDAQNGKLNSIILDIINENNASSDTITQYVTDLIAGNVSIPEGYDSLENYKRDFVKTAIESKTIDDFANKTIFIMTKDSVMFEELVGCKKLVDLLVKNLKNPNLQSAFVERLKTLSIQEFEIIFGDETMIDFLDNMSIKELGVLLKTFGKNLCSSWLASDAFVNKVVNLEIDDFYKVIKDAGYSTGNLNEILERGEGKQAYTKFLDAVASKFYTEELIMEDLTRIDSLRLVLPSLFRVDDNIEAKIDNIKNISRSIIERLKDRLVKQSDIEIFRKNGYFGFQTDGKNRYYDITFKIGSKTETITLNSSSNMIDLEYTLLNKPQYAKAILSGELKITDFSVNVKKSNLVLTAQRGLGKGLNEIVLLADGKEYKLIVNSIFKEKDLNYEANEDLKNAKTIEIVSVKNIGSHNIAVEDTEALYKVTLKGDGILREVFMTTPEEFELLDKDNSILSIDDFIAENNIFGVTDVFVEKVDPYEIKDRLPRIDDYKAAHDVFTQNKYGGNQSDVKNILKAKLYGEQQSSLDVRKADLLNNLIEKYFPQATDIQKINIATHYARGGCVWMAFANAFMTYIGSVENGSNIFKEKFGFDLNFREGDTLSYNLEALVFDMYLSHLSKQHDGNIDSLCEFKEEASVTLLSIEDQIANYFKERGFGFFYKRYDNDNMSGQKLNNKLLSDIMNDKDGFNILIADNFDINAVQEKVSEASEDGALQNAKTDGTYQRGVGAHAMLITGVSDKLNLLVSSWSGKYEFLSDSIADYRSKGKTARAEIWKFKFEMPNVGTPKVKSHIEMNSQDLEVFKAQKIDAEKTLKSDVLDLDKTLEDIEIDDDEIKKNNKTLLDRLRKEAPVNYVLPLSDMEIIIKRIQYDKLISNALIKSYFEGNIFELDEELASKINLVEKLGDEISQGVGSLTLEEARLVQKYKENSQSNTELKRKILEKVEHITDAFGKARALYIELNRTLHYDQNYIFGNDAIRKALTDQSTTFSTLNSEHKVICKGWAELYRELLIEAGFSEQDVSIKGKNHFWVEIAMGENILIADATDKMQNGIDISLVKGGMQTEGFILLPKSYSGIRLNSLYKQGSFNGNVLDNYNKTLLGVDRDIGYATENGYLIDQLKASKKLFGNRGLFTKLFKKDATQNTIRDFWNMPTPPSMDGYEIYAYYRTIFKNILTDDEYAKLGFRSLSHKIANDELSFLEKNVESVFIMSYTNEDGSITRYAFSKSLGKHVLQGENEFQKFLSDYNI